MDQSKYISLVHLAKPIESVTEWAFQKPVQQVIAQPNVPIKSEKSVNHCIEQTSTEMCTKWSQNIVSTEMCFHFFYVSSTLKSDTKFRSGQTAAEAVSIYANLNKSSLILLVVLKVLTWKGTRCANFLCSWSNLKPQCWISHHCHVHCQHPYETSSHLQLKLNWWQP